MEVSVTAQERRLELTQVLNQLLVDGDAKSERLRLLREYLARVRSARTIADSPELRTEEQRLELEETEQRTRLQLNFEDCWFLMSLLSDETMDYDAARERQRQSVAELAEQRGELDRRQAELDLLGRYFTRIDRRLARLREPPGQ